jgi:hypothetical protein
MKHLFVLGFLVSFDLYALGDPTFVPVPGKVQKHQKQERRAVSGRLTSPPPPGPSKKTSSKPADERRGKLID